MTRSALSSSQAWVWKAPFERLNRLRLAKLGDQPSSPPALAYDRLLLGLGGDRAKLNFEARAPTIFPTRSLTAKCAHGLVADCVPAQSADATRAQRPNEWPKRASKPAWHSAHGASCFWSCSARLPGNARTHSGS